MARVEAGSKWGINVVDRRDWPTGQKGPGRYHRPKDRGRRGVAERFGCDAREDGREDNTMKETLKRGSRP
jgi:hypothetical protein